MDLTTLLTHASSHDPNVRNPAEAQLNAFRDANPAGYFSGLVTELANEAKDGTIRQLAGLILKNALTSKNEAQAIALGQRWLQLDPNVRNQVKAILLQTLGSSAKPIRSTASLVVAKIAAIEIPNNAWNELIGILVNNIIKSTSIPLRQASFEALGYVCEEVPEHLQQHSNLILNAIATGMKKEETNNDIKLAATIALANSLEFVRQNFENQNERNLIMSMVFTSTQSEDEKVRIAAYQCLVEIGGVYYDLLAPYMNDIFRLTAGAIQNEKDGVAQQAIEFWSTICDVEMEIQNEVAEAQLRQETYDRTHLNLAKQALTNLIPLLLNTLTKQNEDVDDDTWNAAMAAGTCLGLMAQTTGDAIVGHVLPWVQQNITNSNWRQREAATLAFGCILDGPNRTKLADLVTQAFPLILNHTKDTVPLVRDTAAWTIGRVCDLIPQTISANLLPQLIQAFLQGLQDVPKVASNVCWAILNLASKADSDGSTSPLSPHFETLVRALLTVTERSDVNEANLLTSAYEAINELINTAAEDTFHLVQQLVPTLIKRLTNTLLSASTTGHEREKVNEVQALLCSALYMIIQRLQETVVTPHADTLMTLFLRVLQSKNATVHEEALMAIAAIATVVNRGFVKYMTAFKPFLIVGLANAQEHRVCQVAVGVVGDLSRALEEDFIPISDDVMKLLLEHLQNNLIERSVKPHIFSCMGDIALAVGPFFERYMVYVMRMLEQASTIKAADLEEDEKYDYLNELRTSILEAYTGILQGLGETKASSFTAAPQIMNFVDTIVSENVKNEDVLRAAVGLIGDLGSRLGPVVVAHMNRPSVKKLIDEAAQSSEDTTKEVAQWTKDVLRSLGLAV